MTYRELKAVLDFLSEEQLDSDVTMEVNGEYYEASLDTVRETDVLDRGHPVFCREKSDE